MSDDERFSFGSAAGDFVCAVLPEADRLVRVTLIAGIETLLEECTPGQVALFHRLRVDALSGSEEKLTSAYELVRRTVVKNREGRDDG